MGRRFRYKLDFRIMANVLGLFFIGILPPAIFFYYLAEAIQLQRMLDEGRTIAYVVIAFISISLYLLGVLAMYLFVRWYEKNVAYLFVPKEPPEKPSEEV